MDAFETLYKTYYDQVYFYMLKLSGNTNIAEEITQEAFFKVLKKLDTFKGDCKINVWITQIAKNTYFNYCRRKKLDPVSVPEDLEAGEDLEQRMVDRDTADQIHLILHRMQEPYREVFWMRTFGELSFREIARIHGKTESWARVTYHRARLMIKERLK